MRIFAVGAMGSLVWAASPVDPINKDGNGVALKGYDPSRLLQREWTGARWQFASAANRDAFQAGPDKFAPQYGRYCTYAVIPWRKGSLRRTSVAR